MLFVLCIFLAIFGNFPILFFCNAAFRTQNIPLDFLSWKLTKTENMVRFNFDPNSCTNVRKRKLN